MRWLAALLLLLGVVRPGVGATAQPVAVVACHIQPDNQLPPLAAHLQAALEWSGPAITTAAGSGPVRGLPASLWRVAPQRKYGTPMRIGYAGPVISVPAQVRQLRAVLFPNAP